VPALVLGAAEQPASSATVLAAARMPSPIFLDVIGNVIPSKWIARPGQGMRGMLIQVTDTAGYRHRRFRFARRWLQIRYCSEM
jgi:hypothetical protein